MIWQPYCSWEYASNQLEDRAPCGYGNWIKTSLIRSWVYVPPLWSHIDIHSPLLLGVGADNNNPENLNCGYGGHDHLSLKRLKGYNCPTVDALLSFFCSNNLPVQQHHQRSQSIMDHNLSQVPRKSNTPDTEGHNGRTCQTGNESAENSRFVVSQFIHGNRGHTSKVLQPPVDQSTGSVATEVATSVGTSLAGSMASTLSPSAMKAVSQDLPPLNARKRAAVSSILPRKRRRHSYSTSQIPGRSQLVHRRRSPSLIKISRDMVNETIQYLLTLSDRISISDTISHREWATMHLATQLLQSRYEEIIVSKETETDAVSDFESPPTQPEERCQKCAAADEERLYD
ncbi:unnamed protein product [Penicillium nalgiovense]|nr:unnamed protein product [Penicillium nalgiovense]